jgi:glycosyltransferase A (GT-A) superfamily protein (DUF2064 family)
MVLVDDPSAGVPGLTADPQAAEALLTATLELTRQVGGVGRVLLFRPAEVEARLASRALGFRLWPQEGDTPAERYANAFRQAVDLGYEGALVLGPGAADLPPERLTSMADALDQHQGVLLPDARGGVAVLALQRPEPTLFPPGDVPTAEQLRTRARQQLVRLLEVDPHPGLTPDSVGDFLARTGG